MSVFNFQVNTSDGKNAISSLYNSYYIAIEGTADLINPNPYLLRTATIYVPAQIMPWQMPLLLLKNTFKAMVGCSRAIYSNGKIVAWEVYGGSDEGFTTFDYAIAVAENGVISADKYGFQVLAPDGVNVYFDSRRKNSLIYLGTGGISAGYFEESEFQVSVTSYDYFTAPMFAKNTWVQTSDSTYMGAVCCRGTGPSSAHATAYIVVRTPTLLGTGGSPAAHMLFFAKAP